MLNRWWRRSLLAVLLIKPFPELASVRKASVNIILSQGKTDHVEGSHSNFISEFINSFLFRVVMGELAGSWQERSESSCRRISTWIQNCGLKPWSTKFSTEDIDTIACMIETVELEKDEVVIPSNSEQTDETAGPHISFCVLHGQVTVSLPGDENNCIVLLQNSTMNCSRYGLPGAWIVQ